MTSSNILVGEDSITAITDGAATGTHNNKQVLVRQDQKVLTITHVPAMMIARGTNLLRNIAYEAVLSSGSTIEEIRQHFVSIFKSMLAPIQDQQQQHLKGEICIAGWSKLIGPQAFVVVWHDSFACEGTNVGDIIDVPHGIILPMHESFRAEFLDLHENFSEQRAIDLVTRQRALPLPLPDGRTVHAIGAFVQVTTLFPGRIESRVIHRFPDKLGEPINPGRT